MGSSTSRPQHLQAPPARDTESVDSVYDEKHGASHSAGVSEAAKYLRELNLNTTSEPAPALATNPITIDALSSWEQDLLSDPKNLLTQQALGNNAIADIVKKSDAATKARTQHYFNTTVATIGNPLHLNSQASSGRCWIFATSNVLRTHVIKKYNLKDDGFQVSQAYLFFYDKLEKTNFFLEQIIDTADEPLDSRLVSFLINDPVGDGGQWDFIINLVEKYGVVPNEVFPDNAQAVSSGYLNSFLTLKLREYALVLRKLVAKGVPKAVISEVKAAFNKEAYNIISLSLGTPPKPNDKFVWEFKDKDDKYKFYESTPLDFYKNHVDFNATEYFSVINDPRNAYDKLYTVDRLNNVYGGKTIEYVNTEISEVKKVVIRQLKDNEPVFFGSDVLKFSDRVKGTLDQGAFDLSLAFNTHAKADKADRIRTGSSVPNHAMVITGVHIDPLTNEPVRWKIENSWGDVGDHGYFVMSDDWFTEFVFQIVTKKKYVEKKTYEVYKAKQFTVLPFYDPLGALA
ncbi:peptidase C1B, bleomycin hydrolase [Suhomyces tanzawaensis NRRL Y-17324]|uniref:Cysteine proteinase 1, mitochondrial n=1 Tax=Suhomyces tanzawaensis NRRL Y-17324 TaxID=984487 RepID=A0A1E4SAZ6_9ASCO|nr:peptidase C1B, bleomycin hydrolase [Suhomyces tanzawaensis NRRL Y-17324]ODV76648.1 peptidase C1B, bleomycin hydrolase [Suhomyces tanzawaensis NRRL Y-17324]